MTVNIYMALGPVLFFIYYYENITLKNDLYHGRNNIPSNVIKIEEYDH